MTQKVNKLAAIATYGQLYNDGQNDTYVIVSKFIEHVILSDKINNFRVEEMSELLNSSFGFSIPNYVVQSAVNKIDFVIKQEGKYIVSLKDVKSQDNMITENLESTNRESEALTNRLIKYVKDHDPESSIDIDRLVRNFSSFLLDESFNGEYSDIISRFIIENETDEQFLKQINKIKEGAILFSGLNYTSDISKLKWNSSIILYVGTEVLFHLAGYNGLLFQQLASDMFNLIDDMNIKNQKRIIEICYFKEVQEEIENFFGTAEEIVRGNKIVDVGNVAMETIIAGCSEPSDVVKKHAEFKKLLRKYSIKPTKSVDYYAEKYHDFNIESQELIEKYDLLVDKKEKYLKMLNYVSVLRGRDAVDTSNAELKNSKHLIVTEIGKMLQISKDFSLDNKSFSVPFAINMYILTNRLWFDLNKGFGSQNLPANFDILNKSRIILSNILTQNVSKRYDKVLKSYRSGELSEDDLNENILLLRENTKKPEEIHKELLKDMNKIITPTNLEVYRSQKEALTKQVHELEQEKLDTEIEKDKEASARRRVEEELKSKDEHIIEISKENKAEKQRRLDDFIKRKNNVDNKINFRLKMIRIGISIISIFLICFGLYLHYKCKIDILFSVLAVLPATPFILSLLFGKKFDSLDMVGNFLNFIKKKYEKRLYADYNIDLDELSRLQGDSSDY